MVRFFCLWWQMHSNTDCIYDEARCTRWLQKGQASAVVMLLDKFWCNCSQISLHVCVMWTVIASLSFEVAGTSLRKWFLTVNDEKT